MFNSSSGKTFCLFGCLTATAPRVPIAVTEHTVPLARDKHLVITDNSFPDWTRRAKEGPVCLHNVDYLD